MIQGQPGMPRHPRTAPWIAENNYRDRTGAKRTVVLPIQDQQAGCPANGGIAKATVIFYGPGGGFQKVMWWIGYLSGKEFVWAATRNLAVELLWLESIERSYG